MLAPALVDAYDLRRALRAARRELARRAEVSGTTRGAHGSAETMQLELFHGEHLPLMRCITALDEGDLQRAREALAGAQSYHGTAVDLVRLDAIAARVSSLGEASAISPEEVHAAFEEALREDTTFSPGEIPAEIWFRAYAQHIAAALDARVEERFRGWCALHFDLAAHRPKAALRSGQRLISTCGQGWAWLEAARGAIAAGEAQQAARWVLFACLKDEQGLDPDPPRIAPAAASALNPPPGSLPRLPREIEDLWSEVEVLELPGPASGWIPAVGIIDGVFSPSLLGWSLDLEGTGFNPTGPIPAGEPRPRAFLRALLAARHARVAGPVRGRRGYSDAEVAARVRMKSLAPGLLARYLARLEGRPVRP